MSGASDAGAHAEAICPLRRAVQFPAQRPCAATEREGGQSAAIYGFALRVSPLAPPPCAAAATEPGLPHGLWGLGSQAARCGLTWTKQSLFKKKSLGGSGCLCLFVWVRRMEMVGENGESLPPLSQRVPAVPCRGPPVSEGGRLGPVWPPPGPCPHHRPVSGLLWWPRSPVFLRFAPLSAWVRVRAVGSRVT